MLPQSSQVVRYELFDGHIVAWGRVNRVREFGCQGRVATTLRRIKIQLGTPICSRVRRIEALCNSVNPGIIDKALLTHVH